MSILTAPSTVVHAIPSIPALDLTAFALPRPTGRPVIADEWSMGYSTAAMLTDLVLDRLEDGEPNAVAELWESTDAEYRAEFTAYLKSINAPVTTFAEWVELCRTGESITMPVSPAPVAAGYYEPTAEDLADYAAWCAEMDARDEAMRGLEMEVRADAMDAMLGSPLDRLHDAELAECGARI